MKQAVESLGIIVVSLTCTFCNANEQNLKN